MRKTLLVLAAVVCLAGTQIAAAECTQTGFYRDGINMTALLVNPTSVTGDVDASGCNIAVYIDSVDATITHATIRGANYFGVVVNGDVNTVSASITFSDISEIHDAGGLSGAQHGVAVYFRGLTVTGSASGTVANNTITNYNKGGIVLSGQGVNVAVNDNTVTGWGGAGVNQAMNGIQVSYGATGSVMRNRVSKNSYGYCGPWSAAGILVIGGPALGTPYTINARVMNNILDGNDVGVYAWQAEEDNSLPTTVQTNIKIVGNTITKGSAANLCGWDGSIFYMAGISDYGVNDKIINNSISGYGANPPSTSGAIDLTGAMGTGFVTSKPKVHANKD